MSVQTYPDTVRRDYLTATMEALTTLVGHVFNVVRAGLEDTLEVGDANSRIGTREDLKRNEAQRKLLIGVLTNPSTIAELDGSGPGWKVMPSTIAVLTQEDCQTLAAGIKTVRTKLDSASREDVERWCYMAKMYAATMMRVDAMAVLRVLGSKVRDRQRQYEIEATH